MFNKKELAEQQNQINELKKEVESLTSLTTNLKSEIKSLQSTSALISRSSLVVGNDSGLTKVAIALKIPTITMWGPSDFFRTRAWLDGNYDFVSGLTCSPCYTLYGVEKVEKCSYNYKCLRVVKPKEVISKIEDMLRSEALTVEN